MVLHIFVGRTRNSLGLLGNFLLGERLGRANGPSSIHETIDTCNRLVEFFPRGHVDKGKPTGLTSLAIAGNADQFDRAEFCKQIPNFTVRRFCQEKR